MNERQQEMRTRPDRSTILFMMLAMLLLIALLIDWTMALTGVTAAVIGGIFRVVLQVVRP